jgi:serine/threonine-protein kinase PknG
MKCLQPGCSGSILDGYCDVCGLAAVASTGAAAASPSVTAASPSASSNSQTGAPPSSGGAAVATSTPPSVRTTGGSSRLGSAPIGSARQRGTGSRQTRRLTTRTTQSRLGAGLVQVPSVEAVDPRSVLMDPPVVAEHKRFCSVCQSPVGRGRDGAAGRSKGFCAQCRTPFDFEPKLAVGTMLGGQYEVIGCLAHGGMGWIYLARDRNVNDRWVVLKGLLNTGDPDATRAAIAEKQFLAEVEHPLIVEIYNFVTAADGASYIVMEYVGGQSLNNLIKQRTAERGGVFTPIDVEQAIAYIIEILPAFSYLHSLGLLYCDFKPANLIQVGDGLKLIDLGGVRRVDDDVSPLYGTVGYQAPEVPADGATVASDVYTIARTLATLVFEFKGAQSTYLESLPSADEVPLFARHDSLYRWLLKGAATQPDDRFQSADEMRTQLLGVLREVTALASSGAVTRSTPSAFFETPAIANDQLGWRELPSLTADPSDPQFTWLAGVTADDPAARLEALGTAPAESTGVLLARANAMLSLADRLGGTKQQAADRIRDDVSTIATTILRDDPWEWRGLWLQGLHALQANDAVGAVHAFNAVYGQLPGELAPKLALARACELSGETAVAERLYSVCAKVDSAYTAPAKFGLARIAASDGRRNEALAALDGIPVTSRSYGDARRLRAVLLAELAEPEHTIRDLGAAAAELEQAALDPVAKADLKVQILTAGLNHVVANGPTVGAAIDNIKVNEVSLRLGLEQALRDAAALATGAERVRLIDRANDVRPRTWR